METNDLAKVYASKAKAVCYTDAQCLHMDDIGAGHYRIGIFIRGKIIHVTLDDY